MARFTLRILLTVLTLVLLAAEVAGFRMGAPATDSVCTDMFPEGHRLDSQSRDPPYAISLSDNVFMNAYDKIEGELFVFYFIHIFNTPCTSAYPISHALRCKKYPLHLRDTPC